MRDPVVNSSRLPVAAGSTQPERQGKNNRLSTLLTGGLLLTRHGKKLLNSIVSVFH